MPTIHIRLTAQDETVTMSRSLFMSNLVWKGYSFVTKAVGGATQTSLNVDIPWAHRQTHNTVNNSNMLTLPLHYGAASTIEPLDMEIGVSQDFVPSSFRVRVYQADSSTPFTFPADTEVHLWFEYTEAQSF